MADNAASNKPQSFNPSNVAASPPTYNQVAITPLLPTSKLVTLAGQTGVDPTTGEQVSDEIVGQARQAYRNIANCLKAARASPRDIIHVRHYIVDSGNMETNRIEVVERGWGDVWIEFMDREGEGFRPPDTVLGVASLAKRGILYECEVWAVVR